VCEKREDAVTEVDRRGSTPIETIGNIPSGRGNLWNKKVRLRVKAPRDQHDATEELPDQGIGAFGRDQLTSIFRPIEWQFGTPSSHPHAKQGKFRIMELPFWAVHFLQRGEGS